MIKLEEIVDKLQILIWRNQSHHLAGAQAQFTQAKSDLLIAKLTYENIIGKISDPNQLKKNSKCNCKYSKNFK